jgi:hypothetical protein
VLFNLALGPTGQSTPEARPRPGNVRVSGRSLADDRGAFPALGASLFWAAWGYKHDRSRLDADLALLAGHGFDYIRALGVVGRQPYWKGREIDWRWPDYKSVIAGLTDHAYDTFGLRVEWTLFADADQVIPDRTDRITLVDTFVEMSRGREHKIIHFELANEAWQNGFGDAAGLAELRELSSRLASRTEIPVAISDSEGHTCAEHLALYKDMPVEILTEHFPRDVNGPLRRWGPVLAPWQVRTCVGLPPVVSNNEPAGPKSSITSEEDPMRLVGAAIASYMAGVGLYVFHTDAGIWGREPLASMPNVSTILDGFAAMSRYLPPDIVNWTSYRHVAPEHPFVPYAGDTRAAVSTGGAEEGAVEVLASVKGSRFFVVPIGVANGLRLEAKRALRFDVIHPLTGAKLAAHELTAGQVVRLQPLPILVLSGELR